MASNLDNRVVRLERDRGGDQVPPMLIWRAYGDARSGEEIATAQGRNLLSGQPIIVFSWSERKELQ